MIEAPLRALNDMQKYGIIKRYAIGGAVGVQFYTQPFLTIDLDVFISLLEVPGGPAPMTLIYDFLRKRGYRRREKYIMIGGIPVEFLHAGSPLLAEALDKAKQHKFKGIPVRVFRPEYLIAIALDLGRLKDLAKAKKLVGEARINRTYLMDVLRRYKLIGAWRDFNRFK